MSPNAAVLSEILENTRGLSRAVSDLGLKLIWINVIVVVVANAMTLLVTWLNQRHARTLLERQRKADLEKQAVVQAAALDLEVRKHARLKIEEAYVQVLLVQDWVLQRSTALMAKRYEEKNKNPMPFDLIEPKPFHELRMHLDLNAPEHLDAYSAFSKSISAWREALHKEIFSPMAFLPGDPNNHPVSVKVRTVLEQADALKNLLKADSARLKSL